MGLDAASCAALLEKSRYDLKILPQLEEYCAGSSYDLDANLATLKLHGCYRLYDDDIIQLLRRSPALTTLALEHAAALTVKTLRALSGSGAGGGVACPKLEHLSLSGCTQLAQGEQKEEEEDQLGMRVDGNDDQPYTRDQFIQHYG